MKRSLIFLLPVLLATSFLQAAGTPRENRRLAEGKITKNQAQHLVLKKFPDATIKSCVLTNGHEHGIWVVTLIQAGSRKTNEVSVDGNSGKLVP